MTQKNIDVMDIIVSRMAEGDKLSKALKKVYTKRNVAIPYIEGDLNESVMNLGMTSRSTNALLRARLRTVADVVDFCQTNKITEIVNLGRNSGIEVFEAILNYCWDHMSQKERAAFLIDTVERNGDNIREGIA